MTSRDAILARIRRSMGVSAADATRRATVADRLQRAPHGILPARGQIDRDARIALFCQKAEAVHATTARLASAGEIPAAVAGLLRANNLPQLLRRGADPRLAGLPWSGEPQLTVTEGPSDGSDLVCLSHAAAGVAETGTLVLLSGPDNPTTLNFLPDFHIVVVDAETIAGSYEEVFSQLRQVFGAGQLPRTVNMVTGPSRSADIEQTLLLGAHGPRSLHILVVG